MTPHRSSVWPLAWTWAALIVYASLHPFSGWRLNGPLSGDLFALPWVHYTPRFDMVSNFLAYVPLSFLLTTGWRREGHPAIPAWLGAAVCGSALSYAMEVTQHALPSRVPSILDWYLNSAGAACGALLALAMHRWHVVDRLRQQRNRWIVPRTGGGQTLLLLWPLALLFPPPVPLGLGQVFERLTLAIEDALDGTPWADRFADWAPQADHFEPLSPVAEMTVVTLGLLAPTLVAYTITRRAPGRILMLFGAALLGVAATTASTALNFGPDHALSWLTAPVGPGLALALAIGVALAWLPRRTLAGIGLMVLTSLCALVNQAPSDPYYAASLQAWEQGRFIRLHGLAQWIGWIWPYGALLWLLSRLGKESDALPTIAR